MSGTCNDYMKMEAVIRSSDRVTLVRDVATGHYYARVDLEPSGAPAESAEENQPRDLTGGSPTRYR